MGRRLLSIISFLMVPSILASALQVLNSPASFAGRSAAAAFLNSGNLCKDALGLGLLHRNRPGAAVYRSMCAEGAVPSHPSFVSLLLSHWGVLHFALFFLGVPRMDPGDCASPISLIPAC
jgi:hypothetical protein